jgi:hypothetical protein
MKFLNGRLWGQNTAQSALGNFVATKCSTGTTGICLMGGDQPGIHPGRKIVS